MTLDVLTAAQQAFLDAVHYAVVSTLGPQRDAPEIQQTVVWYLREDTTIRFGLLARSIKARNLRHTPIAALTVQEGRRYLTVSGAAHLEPADDDLRYRLAVRYLGADQAQEWVQRRQDIVRASVRLVITRAYGQGV